MDFLHQVEHPRVHHAVFTIYRTPSARDAADTAIALAEAACLLKFLPPPKVVQSSPGIYEVRVAYAHDATSEPEVKAAVTALNKALCKILLARLEKHPLSLPDDACDVVARSMGGSRALATSGASRAPLN
jgi:hypothetical protein